jgi:hypothetical protein
MKKNSLWVAASAIVVAIGLAACTSETADPQPASDTTPASEQADEGKVEKTSSALGYCIGPRPVCTWPDVATCTCGTYANPCRWHCP